MTTTNKDFKVKNGLAVTGSGVFGGTVTVETPTDPSHAATKAYVDGIELPSGTSISETAPSNPNQGALWFNSSSGALYIFYGTFWVEVVSSTGPQGETGATGPAPAAPFTITQSSNNADYPLTISSANQQNGGSGFSDILKIVNSKSGATNINKFLRVTNDGQLEIINSAYTASILLLSNAGALTVPGPINQTNYNAGDVIKTTLWSASDMSFTSTYTQATNSYTTIASKTYTPASSSSYIFVEVYARYSINGAAEDSFFSQLTWNGIEFAAQRQVWINGAGGGTRSSTLFPLAGRITNGSPTGYTLAINARRDSADDTLTVLSDGAFNVKITEVAR